MIEAAARSAVLEVRGLRRSYTGVSGPDLHILRGVDLTLDRGEAVAIVGASGSGKSTLLHLLGALDRPTAGTVLLDGIDIGTLGDEEAASIRNMRLGFVFQFHHLLLDFTALENVMVPALIQGGEFCGSEGAGGRTAGRGRARRPPRPQAGRTLGRRAATGCGRPRPREPPAGDPGRRTDGES